MRCIALKRKKKFLFFVSDLTTLPYRPIIGQEVYVAGLTDNGLPLRSVLLLSRFQLPERETFAQRIYSAARLCSQKREVPKNHILHSLCAVMQEIDDDIINALEKEYDPNDDVPYARLLEETLDEIDWFGQYHIHVKEGILPRELVLDPTITRSRLEQAFTDKKFTDSKLGYRWEFDLLAPGGILIDYDQMRSDVRDYGFTSGTLIVRGEYHSTEEVLGIISMIYDLHSDSGEFPLLSAPLLIGQLTTAVFYEFMEKVSDLEEEMFEDPDDDLDTDLDDDDIDEDNLDDDDFDTLLGSILF